MNVWKHGEKEYPLLLTVAAAEAIDARYEHWGAVAEKLYTGSKIDVGKEAAFLLATLARCGHDAAELCGKPTPTPPTEAQILAMLPTGKLVGLRELILDTIREGLEVSVEVEPLKNGVATQSDPALCGTGTTPIK